MAAAHWAGVPPARRTIAASALPSFTNVGLIVARESIFSWANTNSSAAWYRSTASVEVVIGSPPTPSVPDLSSARLPRWRRAR